MARTKPPRGTPSQPAAVVPPPKTQRRPLNGLFALSFAGLSALSAWLMRVETVVQGVPVNFQSVVEARRFGNGTPLETRFTGVGPVDEVLAFLVVAFLEGSARWDPGVHAQQAYFLLQWFAVVCVWGVEASRRRNAWKAVSFIGFTAFLYQLTGAAVIAPLYYLAYVVTSRDDAYFFQGRELSAGRAVSLLPAVIIGYLIPTVAVYYPWDDAKRAQYLTALWQPAPIIVSVLISVFSFLVPSSSPTAVAKNGDVKHLKRVYLTAGLVAAIAHVGLLYTCLTSDDPRLSLSYVFLPNRATWKDSMGLGLHYIFQVDFLGAFGSTLFWCWLVTYDVLRILGKPTATDLIKAVLGIAFATVVAGPGTTIILVWNWVEDRLVMIENGVKGTWEKPKAA
ncbi:uncharacterized protein F4812DRAFT_444839 [Daldinia caldariorum]|uniref:uncharacterized protein n=1 Tax=Daldinia caldariorum TaxID=326644 RepID=UPI0020087603|nr:uncharacterized protein F4812DRAFT_444839 [Daldinia caldariorum]KAI1463889.1 hypothetical protein F4812DRAFT_444839 [Daldinia caldariorum]